MAKHKGLSRRSFIGYGSSATFVGLSQSPAVALFTTILGGMSQRAWAQSLGLTPRNLVQITQGGAPPCWPCHSFLTPYSSTGANINPGVATRFRSVNGRNATGEYATAQLRGVQVPHMWSYDLPAPGGGSRPMAAMLDNLLSIQGVTTRNAGHGASQEWHFLAPGQKRSTAALPADGSDDPFAGLNINASGYSFRSLSGKTSVTVSSSGNMLTNLLDPFRPSTATTASFRTNKAALRTAYDSLLPTFDELARKGHPGAEALVQNRRGALQLAEINFAALTDQWSGLITKYRDLVSRAIFDPSRPLPGLTDQPIGGEGTRDPLLYRINDTSQLNLHLYNDLRNVVDARTTVGGLAEGFAFSEYVLLNNLSSSIAFGLGATGPLIRESDGSASTEFLGNDQHTTGIYPATFLNILRYRAIYACLLELIERLKGPGIFNETVISIAGEFARNPRADLTGSDHGFTGKVLNLYSGAFDGPLMVGNLMNDGRMGWGAGGVVSGLSRQLNLVDTAVTLAHLLRVPPPFTSTGPVVTLSSNGLVSNIGTTRFV